MAKLEGPDPSVAVPQGSMWVPYFENQGSLGLTYLTVQDIQDPVNGVRRGVGE